MYLDQYQDAGIEPEPDWQYEAEVTRQTARLAQEAAIGWIAEAIPRRLGQGATANDLRRDKQFSKRYAYGAMDIMKHYGLTQREIDTLVTKATLNPELASKGAQVDWEEHILNLCAVLRHELRRVATSARASDQEINGKRAVLRLENELNSQAKRYELVFGNPINPSKIPQNPTSNS